MPSVFESFNAKNLSPLQVARTFIPPKRQFGDLCSRSHSVVLGPRGSGKTTLLKMLQLPALAAWSHPSAEEFIERIDFNAVFVPADIVWRAQFDNLFGHGVDPEVGKRLGLASFTTHVLISLLNAFEATLGPVQRPLMQRFHSTLLPAQEALLVAELARAWDVSPTIPSVFGLKLGLRARLAEIASLAERLDGTSREQAMGVVTSHNYLFLTFYEQVLFAVEIINGLTNQPDRQWALLFDELEIAPRDIRKQLIALLRGTDTKLLIKISMSPYNHDFDKLSHDIGGKAGNDFLPISLSYSDKDDAVPFAEEIVASMLSEMGIEARSPQNIFGQSEFDMGRSDQSKLGSAYAPGSANFRRFSDLSAKDATFRAYLERNDLDLKSLHLISDNQRASVVRKLTSVVTVRDAFLRESSDPNLISRTKLRSRKRPLLYTGASALFALTEGNPRWIIGTLGPLLKSLPSDGGPVPKHIQAKSVSIALNRFRALLSTLPVDFGGDGGDASLLSLIDLIGEYFYSGVVVAPFKPEPPTTFVVDEVTPASVVKALEVALNVGAVVMVPETPDQKLVASIVGTRFRLTYLLAPHFKLPLTTGKSRVLSSVLAGANSSSATPDLFE